MAGGGAEKGVGDKAADSGSARQQKALRRKFCVQIPLEAEGRLESNLLFA